jgi:uncharacterized protein
VNKKKIINDPVYGFISIPNDLIFDIIEHPVVQRLRRIRQLGISDFIYPGAVHSRFHHAIGALHLMGRALHTLREKGHHIWDAEIEGAQVAILLHDIGHGPFSHSLEYSLFPDIPHEDISLWLFEKLNAEFKGRLSLALEIFKGVYPRKFLNQLVAGQLDVDRLDYLSRDSFFTGVQEGTIGSERIIKMLNIVNDELVVEEKGIYSIENFLSARRLMYWQVYLHQAAVSSEVMLTELIRRARHLVQSGKPLMATPALHVFLQKTYTREDFQKGDGLDWFVRLDDADVWASIKFWLDADDFVLSTLSRGLLNRKLFKIRLENEKVPKTDVSALREKAAKKWKLTGEEAKYLVQRGTVSNAAYVPQNQTINILTKTGQVLDVAVATDLPNIKAMSKIVTKHYLCFPKELSL